MAVGGRTIESFKLQATSCKLAFDEGKFNIGFEEKSEEFYRF
jgi:hypothetical protein